jgi:hypothetical protein
MATTVVIATTAVIGFTTEYYKPLQQKSGFADPCGDQKNITGGKRALNY